MLYASIIAKIREKSQEYSPICMNIQQKAHSNLIVVYSNYILLSNFFFTAMDWETFKTEVQKLSEKITDKPDIIIGITRGGLVPARLLSTYLKVKKMYCVSVVKNDEKRSVVTEITEDISGKNVLLVEDMLETGRSLVVAKNHLEEKGANVKTACLYTMPISEISPDYYLNEVDSVLKFPWE